MAVTGKTLVSRKVTISEYPKLAVHPANGTIVLFERENEGMVVGHTTNTQKSIPPRIGTYDDDFDMDDFFTFTGKVEIANK